MIAAQWFLNLNFDKNPGCVAVIGRHLLIHVIFQLCDKLNTKEEEVRWPPWTKWLRKNKGETHLSREKLAGFTRSGLINRPPCNFTTCFTHPTQLSSLKLIYKFCRDTIAFQKKSIGGIIHNNHCVMSSQRREVIWQKVASQFPPVLRMLGERYDIGVLSPC